MLYSTESFPEHQRQDVGRDQNGIIAQPNVVSPPIISYIILSSVSNTGDVASAPSAPSEPRGRVSKPQVKLCKPPVNSTFSKLRFEVTSEVKVCKLLGNCTNCKS
jgi:hypothetical protein